MVALVVVSVLVGLVLVGCMAVVIAYNETPLAKCPMWLEKAYYFIENPLMSR